MLPFCDLLAIAVPCMRSHIYTKYSTSAVNIEQFTKKLNKGHECMGFVDGGVCFDMALTALL